MSDHTMENWPQMTPEWFQGRSEAFGGPYLTSEEMVEWACRAALKKWPHLFPGVTPPTADQVRDICRTAVLIGSEQTARPFLNALEDVGIFAPESDIESWGVTRGEPVECRLGDTLTDALRETCEIIGAPEGAERAAKVCDARAASQRQDYERTGDVTNLEYARHSENCASAIRRYFDLDDPLSIRVLKEAPEDPNIRPNTVSGTTDGGEPKPAAVAELPLLGSNQDSPDPEAGA